MESNKQTPVVSIISLTYNHAPYIRECLDGFLMQQTDFPFEVIIHDDASTDGTTTIIKEYAAKYPDIIKPILQVENQYSKYHDFNLIIQNCFEKCQGKYIAFCEGDDYWTDPLKLQKQVDFLEKHKEYGMIYSDFDLKDEKSGKFTKSIFKSKAKQFPKYFPSIEDFIVRTGYVAPPSWLFKRELLPNNLYMGADGTFVMFAYFLYKTKVYALEESTVVYRKLQESASHSSNISKRIQRSKNILNIQEKLISQFKLKINLFYKCQEHFYRTSLPSLMAANYKKDVEEARSFITEKSAKEKILFVLYDISPILSMNFYRIYKLFNH